MLCMILVMIYLGILAVWDVKDMVLPGGLLLLGTLAALLVVGTGLVTGRREFADLIFGVVPGGAMLCMALVSNKAGMGDGILLLQMDLFFSLSVTVAAFGISMLAMGLFCFVMMVLRKVKGDTRLPYVPFLWMGSLGALLICG